LRILHVINSIDVGGAETFLLRLIQSQESNGDTIFVLIVFPEKNNIDYFNHWTKSSNVKYIYPYKEPIDLKMRFLYKLNFVYKKITGRQFIKRYVEAKKTDYYKGIIQKNKIDIVNSHLLSADFFVYENFATKFETSWVLTSQGCYNDYDNIQKVSQLIPYIKGMTYVAEKNLKIFNETKLALTENRSLVYNSLPKFSGEIKIKRADVNLSENDFVIGQISRSIPEKGLEIAIKAVKKLNDIGYIDIKLILCGPENDYYNNLKNTYSSKNILFFGVVLDPLDYIPLFDVGILPSYFPSESCPSTIAEYLACNKPVISTDAGEIPNMICVGEAMAGLIINGRNPDGLPDYNLFAIAILEYYQDRQKVENDAKIAKMAFAKFDILNAAEKYYSVYEEVINSK
jgi:glycosyltransferase involved in cell wall biosynthesis